jgi:hypothetical protein
LLNTPTAVAALLPAIAVLPQGFGIGGGGLLAEGGTARPAGDRAVADRRSAGVERLGKIADGDAVGAIIQRYMDNFLAQMYLGHIGSRFGTKQWLQCDVE